MSWRKVTNLRGRDGTRTYTSDSDPTVIDGAEEGDLCFNTTDLTMWKLSGGGWVMAANFREVASDEDFMEFMGLEPNN